MNLTKEKIDLIHILRAVVCQDDTVIGSDIDWERIWKLARTNHLETVVYRAAPEDQRARMENTYLLSVARSVRQGRLLGTIESELRDHRIAFAPQKGSILRNDYPDAIYRFMSDIDIYIRPSDREKIRTALEPANGKLRGSESGDDQFIFPANLGVEFHGRLLYRKTKNGIENYPDWSYVDTGKNRLTEEGFALNLIGHAVYDLSKGGPGIRYILDLWVYRHRHSPQPDWDLVWDKLKEDRIDQAAKNLMDLSEYLFGTGEASPVIDELAEYVLAAGLHGDPIRGAASEMARSGSKSKAICKQVFRSRTEFENRYPWVKKCPLLLPVAWIVRLFSSFRKNRSHIKSWLKNIGSTETDEINSQRERLKRFGL